MKKTIKTLVFIISLLAGTPLAAQSFAGAWKTIDDRNGHVRAIVTIQEEDGLLYGHIKEILQEGRENGVCTACEGHLKDKPLVGMRILDGLKLTGEFTWEGGKKALFDPEQGKYFRAKVWWDPEHPDELKVRGYLLFLYRTQTWKRVKDPM